MLSPGLPLFYHTEKHQVLCCVCLSNILGGYDIGWAGLAGKMAGSPTNCEGRNAEMSLWPDGSATGLCCIMSVCRSLIGQSLCHWSKICSLIGQPKMGPSPCPDNASQPGSAETGETYDFRSRKFLKVAIFKNAPILAVRVGLAKWWSGWVPLHLVSAGS